MAARVITRLATQAALVLAALTAGSPSALAQAPARANAPSAAVTQLQGAWELSSQGGARKCRLTLRTTETKGGRAVGFPGPCRRALPVLNRISAWTVSDDGFVRLMDANGIAVITFADDAAAQKLTGSADGAVYIRCELSLTTSCRVLYLFHQLGRQLTTHHRFGHHRNIGLRRREHAWVFWRKPHIQSSR